VLAPGGVLSATPWGTCVARWIHKPRVAGSDHRPDGLAVELAVAGLTEIRIRLSARGLLMRFRSNTARGLTDAARKGPSRDEMRSDYYGRW